jgi:hypothetical protein
MEMLKNSEQFPQNKSEIPKHVGSCSSIPIALEGGIFKISSSN